MSGFASDSSGRESEGSPFCCPASTSAMLMEFTTASASNSRVYFSPYLLLGMCRRYRRGRTIPCCEGGLERERHLQPEVLAEAGYVAGGLDVVVGPGDLPVLADHEGGPDHAHRGLPVQLLLAPSAVGVVHLVVRVGQQREVQPVAVAELGQLGGGVRGDAQDRHPG